MPAVPRDASSVILLRDASTRGGMETLMLKRNDRSGFAGGMYVFPGGMVEECECGEGAAGLCAGVSPEDASSIIEDARTPRRALAFFVAGIRETFEETGILLAYGASGEPVSLQGKRKERFEAYRVEMRDDCLAFQEMIAEEGLVLAVDRLVYFAHWITPEFSPVRFDTHFFLAPAPPLQDASPDNVEMTAHVWIAPREAMKRNENGTLPMLPPTVVNLMSLDRFTSVDEALASTASEDISAISPQIRFEGGRAKLVLPPDTD